MTPDSPVDGRRQACEPATQPEEQEGESGPLLTQYLFEKTFLFFITCVI